MEAGGEDSYPEVLEESREYDEDSEGAGCADSTDCQNEERTFVEGKPLPKRRGTAWSDDQTHMLLEKWSEYRGIGEDIEKTSVVQNSSIYKTISRYLLENGVEKTAEQCKTRIHTLKRSYKVCKAAMAKDINAKKMFRYYDKMDYILGFRSKDPGRPGQPDGTSPEKEATYPYRGSPGPAEVEPQRPLWSPEALYSHLAQSHAEARMFLMPPTTQEAPGAVCIKQEVIEEAVDCPPSKKVRSDSADVAEPGAEKTKENVCTYAQLQNVGAYQLAEPTTSSYTTLKNVASSYSALEPANLVMANKAGTSTYGVDSPSVYQQVDSAGTYTSYVKSSTGKDENANSFHAIEGDAIQRLKLDLEIKKIEMERKKLEIEERQRREEREHQYRMMQLILNGLGQGAAAGLQSEHLTPEAAEGLQNWRAQLTRQAAADQDVTLSESQFL